jgi:hypothetical protein
MMAGMCSKPGCAAFASQVQMLDRGMLSCSATLLLEQFQCGAKSGIETSKKVIRRL